MRSVVVDKIASVTQACGLSHEVRIVDGHSCRGRRGRRRRGADQQVDLQHAGADQRPHGQGRQGRHRRRRTRASQGAVRLLRPRAARPCSPATSSRCSTSAACSASATRSIPTRASRSTAACSACVLHFPYLGERIGVPARVGHKRARLRREARHPRRAGGRARRHLHGSRQDRGGLRHHQPHAPPRARRRCLQGHRRFAAPRHPGDGRCGRAPLADLHRPGRRHDHARATVRRSRAPC